MKIIEGLKISDNGFVFNPKTGDSFSLNPTGLEVIKMLSSGKQMEEIKQFFLENFDADDLTIEKDFYEFCGMMKYFQILVQDNDPMDFK